MYHTFVANSPVVHDLLRVIDEVAKTQTAVLLTGECGVGKELFAEQIHIKSPRAEKPFVRVNCVVYAAATDADFEKKVASAGGGTVFFDEVSALSLALQRTLLALLQTYKERVRVVSATSRNLEQLVASGAFLDALYFRLNMLPLHIPPLRERKADILPLAQFFLRHFSDETKKAFTGFSPLAAQALENGYWQGNVRELKNVVERACIVGTPPLIQADALRMAGTAVAEASAEGDTFAALADDMVAANEHDRTLKTAVNAFKAAYVKRILQETAGNQTEAAKLLDVQRTYVSRLLHELHIR